MYALVAVDNRLHLADHKGSSHCYCGEPVKKITGIRNEFIHCGPCWEHYDTHCTQLSTSYGRTLRGNGWVEHRPPEDPNNPGPATLRSGGC